MRIVKLIDPSRRVVATGQVGDQGEYYGGTIDLRDTPPNLRALFEEFEDIVNNQMFAFLDDIQERIGTLSLKAGLDIGQEAQIENLQVFPSTGDVSFRLAEAPTPSTKRV